MDVLEHYHTSNIKSMKKIHGKKQKTARLTLIGAGITEMYYFRHLNNLKKVSIDIKPALCDREDLPRINKKIKQVLSNDGKAVCVFDADEAAKKSKEGERLKELHKTYDNNPNVLICDSLPAIEYWFLLHYEEKYGEMSAKDALKGVQKHIKNYDKTEQFLQNEKWVEDMLPYLDSACQRARNNTDKPSYSNVYKIFEQQ